MSAVVMLRSAGSALALPGVTETTLAAHGVIKFIDYIECNLLYRYEYHLRDSLARFNFVSLAAPIPY